MTIFIPGNVPSSKSNREIGLRFNPKFGKEQDAAKLIPILGHSKRVRDYIRDSLQDWLNNANRFKEATGGLNKPIRIGFYFYRESRHKFDFPNAVQVLLDCMSGHHYKTKRFKQLPPHLFWIQDDNMDEILPIPLGFRYRPDNPGVEISIIPNEIVEQLEGLIPKDETVLF